MRNQALDGGTPVVGWEQFQDIPGFAGWKSLQPVESGWSGDRKYRVETASGGSLLLRVSDAALAERKREEYRAVCRIAELGIPMSKPLDFGFCSGENKVYGLFSWLEGEEAERALPVLDVQRQYELGVKAGAYLRAIHSISAPAEQPGWKERFNRKIDCNIKRYRACGIVVEGEKEILQAIERNRPLLTNRPQSLQHGDYHVGNMILSPAMELGIIDFNRWDYGDPWEEFNRIVWSAIASPRFASGQIDGYIGAAVPEEFFGLMALYIASNAISSIPWAIPFGEQEVETMRENTRKILRWYRGFETFVPAWYQAG